MDQNTRRTLPSKGEVAFRFVACAGIALALYYTPELKWTSDASNVPASSAESMPDGPAPKTVDACDMRHDDGLLVAASLTVD